MKDSPKDQDDQEECIQETYHHQNGDYEWGMLEPVDQFIKIGNIAWCHGVFAEYEHFTPVVLQHQVTRYPSEGEKGV
ncbi:hypothetical protein ANABIO32_04390 [Rossellomorea marisflavi]|nr:hypothetical protein [Rossellomorea marisflavi]GLI82752.1 hypothetical protein ANABIO32_04390 [Rossellomorea marisflavi]